MKIKLTLLTLLLSSGLFAQEYTISGYMRDANTGEELLYANALVVETGGGVTTNLYGFYSLSLPAGTYTVQYSYLGFETQAVKIILDQDLKQDIELASAATELTEVVVTAEQEDENITNTEVSVVALDIKQVKKIPVLLGEQDILKTVQLLPGISANSEGGSGFFVRGGDADQNLILLDEAPVYNASHLLGFFSVFNSDALKDVKLYKGGMPAQYGGRASSVMDIRMKNGNMKEWEASGGVGLISSRLTVEGPIQEDKGSIIVSGRRTYLDFLVKATTNDNDDLNLYFYDLNLKANYKLGEKDRIYLSGYLGRDAFGVDDFGFDWGNQTLTFRWNHVFNNKLFSNTSLIYSDYDYGFKVANAGVDVDLSAGIYDYNLKQDYTYYLNPNNKIEFGWQGIYHRFKPTIFSFDEAAADAAQEQHALEGGLYISNEQKLSERLRVNYGLRLTSFSNVGPYDYREFDVNDDITNETTYASGDIFNTYLNLEPRLSATYLLNSKSSIKASYNRNAQYLHLLSNSNSGSPTDRWIPSSPLVKPTLADQVAIGYFRNFKDNQYKFSVETYYKKLQNTVDYEDGAAIFSNADIESELVFGDGRAYGIEFLLEKQKGRFTGWLSYALSTSQRQFAEINNGEWFSARQDRTHDISLVATYQLNPKLTLSGTWVYNTGDAVTFPSGKYYIDDNLVNLYTDRNGSRMPDYHRLDLGLTWTLKDSPKFYHDLSFSIYNLYNRMNAFSITFAESETNPGTTEATRTALFGVLPSVTWNFKF